MSPSRLKRKRSDVLSDSEGSNGSADSGLQATGLLNTLQGHIDDLRSLLQCGVCVKLLYEPFTLPCGHTFCYGCLAEWFASQDNKKTCPDCRGVVKTEPAPAYLIRNFVQIFIGRAELLEGTETTEQHLENQRVESARVESAKSNNHLPTGGLFQGCFKRASAAPILDAGDGVERCPVCFWELEEDECNRCGFVDGNWEAEAEGFDDDLAAALEMADNLNHSDRSNSEDDEGGSSEMDSFIEDDEDGRSISALSNSSNSTLRGGFRDRYLSRSRSRSNSNSFGSPDPWEASSSFDASAFRGNSDDNNHGTSNSDEDSHSDSSNSMSSQDDDDDDEDPIGPATRRIQRNPGQNGDDILRMMEDLQAAARTMHHRVRAASNRRPGSNSRNPITLDSDSPHRPSRRSRNPREFTRTTTIFHRANVTRR